MFFSLIKQKFSFVFNHNIIGNQNWKTFTKNFCFWHRVALSISGLAEAIYASLGYVGQAGLSGSGEKAQFLAANHIYRYAFRSCRLANATMITLNSQLLRKGYTTVSLLPSDTLTLHN